MQEKGISAKTFAYLLGTCKDMGAEVGRDAERIIVTFENAQSDSYYSRGYYYCAPNSSSAVNSIYSSENFWENKSTIWHLGMKNQELRIKSLTKFYPDKKSELQYVRSFEFFFWDFCLMLKNNVKKEYILHTCKTIFETQLFQQSLKHKEQYGLKLQKITDKQIVKFINISRHAFIDIKSSNKTLSTIRVLLCLFYHCFFKAQNNLNPIDTLANAGKEFETSTSAEAFYSNFLVQMFKNNEIF